MKFRVERLKADLHRKVWGCELWIHNSPLYTFKILSFLARASGSMHFHRHKTETWFVESGQFHLVLIDPATGERHGFPLRPGDVFHLPAGTMHQLSCLEAGKIFEASTPHDEADTYRICPSTPPHDVTTCQDFTDAILRRTEHFDEQILKDLFPKQTFTPNRRRRRRKRKASTAKQPPTRRRGAKATGKKVSETSESAAKP